MNIRIFLILGFLSLVTTHLFATHNRAGEITYEQIGPLTIRATITTYTKASSTQADQDSLELCWGDGICEQVLRTNGPIVNGLRKGENIGNNTKINFYIAEHTYSGAARYTLSMNDPNRNGGVVNVNPPNSDLIRFHIETTVTLLNVQFQGFNSSPLLLQPPIDFGCVGKRFVHNPNVFEQEGDSISYQLTIPLQDVGSFVPNYTFPDQIGSGSPNELTLDPITGDLIWENPQLSGEYNIAMYIIEYRQGIAVDTMIRDMQIFIENCDNEAPIVEVIDEICILAGDTARIEVMVSDPDMDQKVRLSAIGGPLILDDQPATFTVLDGYQDSPLTGVFEWVPSCDHILGQPYTVVFKGTDNDRDTSGLSTLKTLKIKVIGPPPEDVLIEQASLDSITVTWEKPYFCESTMIDYFRGFSVYRKIGSNQFPLDTCNPGLQGRGYERVAFSSLEMRNGRYIYLDQNIQKGQTYCYRIIAEFARLTLAGNPFNFVESLPSEERCVQIGRDLPLITNVSVTSTGISDGSIRIVWTKPLPIELDTIANPGPYRYQLLRGEGKTSSGFTEISGASFTSNTFSGLVDTIFSDNNFNTADLAYTYQVAFYTGSSSSPFGFSDFASSVYLNVAPTDRSNILSWCNAVPWQNYEFEIYKKDNNTGIFSLLTMTIDTTFVDRGLTNGEESCYFIRSVGTYGIDNIANPLFNLSQEDCGTPFDNVPPCAPDVTLDNNCASAEPGTPASDIINTLNWNNPVNSCPGSEDTDFFKIYFSSSRSASSSDFIEIDIVTDTFYNHTAISSGGGCYFITAVDINGNESQGASIVCIDNCPAYTLPNAFTPNMDGDNDLFRPYPYRYVDRIDMKVYNQWGNLVFETENPDILWDGRDMNNNELSSGAYYYTCKVFESNLDGTQEQMDVLSGFIQLMRSSK